MFCIAGVDPGFPVGGGANPPVGVPTYDFAKFCKKLHEIEKIFGHREVPPLNLPLSCDAPGVQA